MNDLERKLRAAKAEPPSLPRDFSAQVWAEIQRQGVHPIPRWWFMARTMARWTAAALLLLGGVWSANTALYELLANGTVELLYFGTRFLGTFLARLPFDLLLTVAALGILAAWLLRSGRLARIRMAWVVLITYGLTGAGGLAGANSGLNEVFYNAPPTTEAAAAEAPEDGLLGYFRGRMHYRHPHPRIRMGRVVESGDGTVMLETPLGETIRVETANPAAYPIGTHVRLLGDATPKGFATEEVQQCNPQRGNRYFQHMGQGMHGGAGRFGMPGKGGMGGMGRGEHRPMHDRGPRGPMMR